MDYNWVKLMSNMKALFSMIKCVFFHGDGPASAFEAANQKGGHYFFPSCDIHLCQTDDIACCYQQKKIYFAETQSLILGGKFGKCNSLSSSL